MNTADDPEQAALSYANRGWPVFPVHSPEKQKCSCNKSGCKNPGKHPRINGWQEQASTDPIRITQWWLKWPNANIGIPTGLPIGAFVLDIDPRHGGDQTLDQLEDKHGKLPETVEAISGGGGRHKLFGHPGGEYRVANDGKGVRLGQGLDIRGDGGLFIVAPSLHISGSRYEWEASSMPGDVPIAPAPAWLLESVIEDVYRETEDTEKQRLQSNCSVSQCLGVSVNEDFTGLIPAHEGQRNQRLFHLARALRGKYPKAVPESMRPVLVEWHKQSLPFITTKDFGESWDDFLYAWPRVKFPEGTARIDQLLAKADASELPAFATRYESETTRRLVKLCREMQREAGDEPFFISCRIAGRLLRIDHMTASKRLLRLRGDGVLTVAETYTATKATRYRYVGKE